MSKRKRGLVVLGLIMGAFSYVVYRAFKSFDIDLLDGWDDEENADD